MKRALKTSSAPARRNGDVPIEPLLLDAAGAAAVCGVSRSHWLAMNAAGRIPLAFRLGRRVLWRADELRRWIAAGLPARDAWEASKLAGDVDGRRR